MPEVSETGRAIPKSATLTAPLHGEHDVCRLDVAMNDAGRMAARERIEHARGQFKCSPTVSTFPASRSTLRRERPSTSSITMKGIDAPVASCSSPVS